MTRFGVPEPSMPYLWPSSLMHDRQGHVQCLALNMRYNARAMAACGLRWVVQGRTHPQV